jgi:histidinol-phosphate aminotransferase
VARVPPVDRRQRHHVHCPRGLHRYLDRQAGELRGELAERHGIPLDRLVVGGGIAQLMTSAAQALLEPGDELVTPWPSYPLYPAMARRAHGLAVPVSGFGTEPCWRRSTRARASSRCATRTSRPASS